MPSARTPLSYLRGTSAITRAPTNGRRVAIVIAEFSQVMRLPLPFSETDAPPFRPPPLSPHTRSYFREGAGHHHDPREQEDGVPLDVARLDVPQQTAGEAGEVR